MTLVVRTRSAPAGFASLLRNAIWTIDKDQPVTRVQTMEQVIADYLGAGVVVTTLMGSYAGLALALAMAGVFGVVAYTVQQRTHEIGIRMALGAQGRDILRMVARKGIVLGVWAPEAALRWQLPWCGWKLVWRRACPSISARASFLSPLS